VAGTALTLGGAIGACADELPLSELDQESDSERNERIARMTCEYKEACDYWFHYYYADVDECTQDRLDRLPDLLDYAREYNTPHSCRTAIVAYYECLAARPKDACYSVSCYAEYNAFDDACDF
jgi:hypothetical protein